MAGFPCQPFSVEGKAKGFDDTNSGHIFQHIVDYITRLLPKSFILENVANIQHHNKGMTLKFIESEIDKIEKYNVYTKEINTADHGTPQNRKRFYICGI